MTDHAPSMMEYLLSLSPEQAADAVNSLSAEQKSALVNTICGSVNTMAASIVEHADAVWDEHHGC
jgi:hypothetical protein